ncbi:uncharacterized protein [Ptychodera flava]|uniref:uncharacterized protein n=1 Tax=Ptychodera flava TaxID=63121 RepID=UPI00396A7311
MFIRAFLAVLIIFISFYIFTFLWLNIENNYSERVVDHHQQHPTKEMAISERAENRGHSGTTAKGHTETSSMPTSSQWGPLKFVDETGSSTRFLLYINAIGRGGPNCQYGYFRTALEYSIAQNRSIVNAVMFFEHNMFTMHEKLEKIRTLEETFDVKQLKKIVNIIPVKEFDEKCNRTVETVIASPITEKYMADAYETSAKLYSSAFGVALPEHDLLPETEDQLVEQLKAASSMKCVGIWILRHTVQAPSPTTIEKVTKHMVLSPDIQHSASSIRENVFKGQPYLAVHWRNKPQEIYKSFCENFSNAKNPKCEYYTRDLRLMKNATHHVAKSIQNFMKANNLTQVYVATPPMSTNIMKVLRSLGVAKTFSAENMTSNGYAKEMGDPYIWSLLEQQICINSDVFIGHYNSTWSFRVRESRSVNLAKSVSIKEFLANNTSGLFSRRR